ncbi:hypothetical protein F5884DRAFT_826955 [Xylogone sp. PMI_703]|nr:hypothetical protein F5884DRAFT_826955 [Xylogone sp. PMI_703]
MSLTVLSTEVLQRIYELSSVQDLLHLAQTSKKTYNAFIGYKLPLLEQAVYNTYSPVPELYKLVISSEPDGCRKPLSTEVRRDTFLSRIMRAPPNPFMTFELIVKMVQFGKVAAKWTEFWPRLCWKYNYFQRRLLRPHEQERLRAAIYRYWIYNNLFHDELYVRSHQRMPLPNDAQDPRLRFLRSFTTIELIQLSDFVDKLQLFVSSELFSAFHRFQFRYRSGFLWHYTSHRTWAWEDDIHRPWVVDVMKFDPEVFMQMIELLSTSSGMSLKRDLVGYLELPSTPRQSAASLGQAIFAVGVERFATDSFAFLIDSGSLRYRKLCDMSLRYGIIDDPQDCHCSAEKYGFYCDYNPMGMWMSHDQYVERCRNQTGNENLDGEAARKRVRNLVIYQPETSLKLDSHDLVDTAHQRVRVIHSLGVQYDEEDENYVDASDIEIDSASKPAQEAKIIFCGNCKAFLSIRT